MLFHMALSRKNLWEQSPRSVRAVLGHILSVLPLDRLLGRQFRNCLRLVTDTQWWPAERLRAYQLQQLRSICTLAFTRTRFYRRLFDESGFDPRGLNAPEDLRQLPTIDQDTLRNHLDEMLTVSPKTPTVDYASTGGTTGSPVEFYINSDRSYSEYAHLASSWARIGYTLATPLAVLRGRVVKPDRQGLCHEYDPLLRHHYYSSFHLSDEAIASYLRHITTLGPCFLHVYPSSVAALAWFVRRTHALPPTNIRGIIAESEIVYPEQRRLVSETFNCRYFSCYGHSEKVALASECEYTADYHVWPTYSYVELLDPMGRPVAEPGEQGEITGTGFINRVVPFIRYKTGDLATYVKNKCERCGREHLIIRDIRGHRSQECLVARDDSEIAWTALNMHDNTFRHVRRFQFVQEAAGRAVLRLVPGQGFSDEDQRRILKNLGRKLDGRVAITIELVKSIRVTPRGKAVYVDQRVARRWDWGETTPKCEDR